MSREGHWGMDMFCIKLAVCLEAGKMLSVLSGSPSDTPPCGYGYVSHSVAPSLLHTCPPLQLIMPVLHRNRVQCLSLIVVVPQRPGTRWSPDLI